MESDIKIWYQKHMSAPFDIKSFYCLFDLILCISGVCLPYKIEYWKYDNICPYHPIMHEMGMSLDSFTFLWIHFHISSVDLSDVEN